MIYSYLLLYQVKKFARESIFRISKPPIVYEYKMDFDTRKIWIFDISDTMFAEEKKDSSWLPYCFQFVVLPNDEKGEIQSYTLSTNIPADKTFLLQLNKLQP